MRGILPDNIVARNADTLEDDWLVCRFLIQSGEVTVFSRGNTFLIRGNYFLFRG